MDATKDLSVRFNAMPDDTTVAVGTHRRQRVDCTLETVKSVTFSAHDHFKRLVIIILANFAFSHTQFVRARGGSRRCQIERCEGNSNAKPPQRIRCNTDQFPTRLRRIAGGAHRESRNSAQRWAFSPANLKRKIRGSQLLGIVSIVSLLALVATQALRREDTKSPLFGIVETGEK